MLSNSSFVYQKKIPLQSIERSKPELVSSSAASEVSNKKEFPRRNNNPSLSEVTDFFIHKLNGDYENAILRNCDRNAEAFKFFHYYEAKGWLINGKIPMKNWKMACRSWVAKIPFFTRANNKSSANMQRNYFNVDHGKNYEEPL